MPKKRQPFKSFKPYSSGSPTSDSANRSATRSVNDILANLRQTSIGPSVGPALPANTPSVPPAIREILQIPETPAPAPRRPGRTRFDHSGHRLPAGPPPPRSWVSGRSSLNAEGTGSALRSRNADFLISDESLLPGAYLPARGSLIDITLHRIAYDWDFHRVYNQYYLYDIPGHLKPALIRHVCLRSSHGISLADLKMILLPPIDPDESDASDADAAIYASSVNSGMTYLDLSGCSGRSIKIKEVTNLLFPFTSHTEVDEPQDSWDADAATNQTPGIPQALLPNLTHLSLALDPDNPSKASWRQLLALSSKASTITHLSLAYWPTPCFAPRAQSSVVTSPQGQRINYGGTSVYSHSLDDDWNEALLILRMLSRNLYELEYLDLTGCSPWFPGLLKRSGHDFVDWAGSWSKISHLRLPAGFTASEESPVSEQRAFNEAKDDAARVEKHIRAMRDGRGRFITVDRDR